MKTNFPDSKGELVFLHLDLDDLSTIKKSAEEFLSKEQKLDVLWNNAGVMVPPQGSKTKQGYEMQLGNEQSRALPLHEAFDTNHNQDGEGFTSSNSQGCLGELE